MGTYFTDAAFIAIFPEFTSVPSAVVDAVQDFINSSADPNKFGADYINALMLLTAHFLTMSKRAGGGPVTSERVGDLSRSYAAFATQRSFEQTSYGMQFLTLLRRKVGGARFAGQRFPAGAVLDPLPPQ